MEEDVPAKSRPKVVVLPPRKFKEDEESKLNQPEETIEEKAERERAFKQAVFKEENLRSDSEYHTASEFIPEFNSDNEPPEDKLTQAKMIFKSDKIRVYKKILKIGKGMIMPAKFDLVRFKYKETLAECMEPSILNDIEEIQGQMGITILDEELLDCLSQLKEGERSSFKIEEIGFDDKKRRTVQRERFLLAEMIWWQTVIDIRGDRNLMKRVIERGNGQKRFSPVDEITFQCTISQSNDPETKIKHFDFKDCLVDSLGEKLPSTLIELLQSAKANEKFECLVKYDYVKENESNTSFKDLLKPEDDLIFSINVDSIFERQDLFNDGSVIKKVTSKSYTTAAPDENSRIYFDYRVFDLHGNLIHSSKQNFNKQTNTSSNSQGRMMIFLPWRKPAANGSSSMSSISAMPCFELSSCRRSWNPSSWWSTILSTLQEVKTSERSKKWPIQ